MTTRTHDAATTARVIPGLATRKIMWAACCPCGWSGKLHRYQSSAEHEAARHNADRGEEG
ncbi:MAG: hypothetical protein ACOYD1_07945 [Candidatus Nanopelagicales bacterium]